MIDTNRPELAYFLRGVLEFLEANPQVLPFKKVSELTPYEFLNCWLTWEGVQGYTSEIVRLMELLGWKAPKGPRTKPAEDVDKLAV